MDIDNSRPLTFSFPLKDKYNMVEFTIVFTPNYSTAHIIVSAEYYRNAHCKTPTISLTYETKRTLQPYTPSKLQLPMSLMELATAHYTQCITELLATQRAHMLSFANLNDKTLNDYQIVAKLVSMKIADEKYLDYVDLPVVVEHIGKSPAPYTSSTFKLDYYLRYCAKELTQRLQKIQVSLQDDLPVD